MKLKSSTPYLRNLGRVLRGERISAGPLKYSLSVSVVDSVVVSSSSDVADVDVVPDEEGSDVAFGSLFSVLSFVLPAKQMRNCNIV